MSYGITRNIIRDLKEDFPGALDVETTPIGAQGIVTCHGSEPEPASNRASWPDVPFIRSIGSVPEEPF